MYDMTKMVMIMVVIIVIMALIRQIVCINSNI